MILYKLGTGVEDILNSLLVLVILDRLIFVMLLNLSALSFCLKATILQTLRTTLVRVWKHTHTQKFDLTKKSSWLMCVVFFWTGMC